MARTPNAFLMLIVTLLFPANSAYAQCVGADTAEVGVRQVVERFGRVLAAGDSIDALSLLHDDVIIYEGGNAETKEQYRSGHVRSDIAFASAVQRTTTSANVILSGEMAVYTSTYKSAGRYRNRGVNTEGTETIVLLRTADGWRIRHIHSS